VLISKKTTFFIVTAVKTSNLTNFHLNATGFSLPLISIALVLRQAAGLDEVERGADQATGCEQKEKWSLCKGGWGHTY
jgi:hypothetical protein